MHVHPRHGRGDRADHVGVERHRQLRVDAALHTDLGGTVAGGLRGALGDLVERQPEGVGVALALGDEVLRVEKLSSRGKFKDINFTIRTGEVVGLAGLVGAGRTEIAQAIFGLDPAATGKVFVNGQPVKLEQKVKVIFNTKDLGKDVGKTVEGIGEKIGDIFGKKKKKGSNP